MAPTDDEGLSERTGWVRFVTAHVIHISCFRLRWRACVGISATDSRANIINPEPPLLLAHTFTTAYQRRLYLSNYKTNVYEISHERYPNLVYFQGLDKQFQLTSHKSAALCIAPWNEVTCDVYRHIVRGSPVGRHLDTQQASRNCRVIAWIVRYLQRQLFWAGACIDAVIIL